MEVTVPDGVSPGQMVQVQTPSGVMQAQVPEGLLPGQKFLIQLAPQPQIMSDAAPEFISSATFAGPKPGYAFKSGAQGAGYYLLYDAGQSQAPTPVMSDAEMAADGLHSVANMYGTWGSCQNWLTMREPLWVSPNPVTDSFMTTSMGWCGFMCACVGAHGMAPHLGPARTYERTPRTNYFTSGTHTAVLLGEREMTVDGRIYYWGPWSNGQ